MTTVSSRFIDFMNAHVAPVAKRMEKSTAYFRHSGRFYCRVTVSYRW